MSIQHLVRSVSRLSLTTAVTQTITQRANYAVNIHGYKYSHLKLKKEPKKYTIQPIPILRTGGRDERGRVAVRRGGENKRRYRMVDLDRKRLMKDDQSQLVEKIISIIYDPNRSANLALVGSDTEKRYIVATHSMKSGDIVKTHKEIPRMPVKPKEGDSHPVGALPLGTVVSCVERMPGQGAKVARAAGSSAVLVRKVDGRCIVRMPSKREMNISETCMVTVGRVSNIDHNKIEWGKAGASRWRGFRPSSGWWQRKDGRYGRKIKPTPPVKVYDKPPSEKPGKMDIKIKAFSM